MIGRLHEKKQLNKLFQNPNSDFVAVYGRRRIGKTYPIREQFGKNLLFQHTGIADVKMSIQLKNFTR